MIRNNTTGPPVMRGTMQAAPVQGGRGIRQRKATLGLFQPLPAWAWIAAFVLTLASLTTIYPLLTAVCVLTLPVCASLLLFKGESPILFACCGMQWLQVVVTVFYCDFYGVTMATVLEGPEVERATLLCVIGILALALGMRLALSTAGRGGEVAGVLEADAGRFDMARIFQFWIFTSALGTIAEGVGWRVVSLHQFVVPFYNLKWVFFFMLSYIVLLRDRGYGLLLIAMAVEFVTGFLGWFSSYKEGLIMFLIVAMTLRRSMNGRLRAGMIAVILLGSVTSVFWASIKADYRMYNSGGKEGTHGLSRHTITERLNWLADRVSRMDEKTLDLGMRMLLARLQYVALFGQTLSHVPRFEPHANGELWLGAVKHVLMPRFIFRSKETLDDSERARRFTGLRLSGGESGTSIGIGYMAESYADFGSVGMFVPVFLLGVLMARIYQVALRNKHSAMLGTAIGTAMLFAVLQAFATSNAKLVGSLVLLSLAYWAMNKVYGERVMRWLKVQQ
ncbi:MAG: hypothetical protein ACKVY0_08380 [Prosthecobacter sp.]|uniref:hypothetical protein n=1 Tax=Prosthecobacter sp. TaxID=1965333 RepID=UPI003902D493